MTPPDISNVYNNWNKQITLQVFSKNEIEILLLLVFQQFKYLQKEIKRATLKIGNLLQHEIVTEMT